MKTAPVFIRSTVGVIAALVGMSACSGSGTEKTDEPPTASSRSATGQTQDAMQIDLPGPTPLHTYFMSPEEESAVSQAQDVLVAQCMKRFGYDYAVPDFSERVKRARASTDEAESRLYGVTDISAARKYGLGLDLSERDGDEVDEQADPSDAYFLVLMGSKSGPRVPQNGDISPGEIDGIKVPAGGCLGDARKQVTGSIGGIAEELGRDLWVQASFRSQSDPKYLAVISEYQACMKQNGYNVTGIFNDEGDSAKFERDLATTQPSQAEIEFVVAQVKCKKDVELVPRLHAIDSQYAAEAIDKNQLALQEDETRIEAAVKKATDLVGQPAQ